LIVITVAAGVIIYYFVSGYVSSSTAGVTNQETFIISKVTSQENTAVKATQLTITVSNTGSTAINITSGTVSNSSSTFYLFPLSSTTSSVLNVVVSPGQTVTFNVLVSSSSSSFSGKILNEGQTYTVTLTTVRGTTQSFSFGI